MLFIWLKGNINVWSKRIVWARDPSRVTEGSLQTGSGPSSAASGRTASRHIDTLTLHAHTGRPNGPAQVSIAGAGGTLSSLWRFAYDSSSVAVSGASYTDTSGRVTPLPDAQVDLACGNTAATINDWNGRYRIRRACLPQEFGEFNTTITVKNATTLSMIDDGDTPADAYEASLIGSSARAIRGFFIDGPARSRYREDFNWTLNLDGSGFSQSSRYVYFEGTQTGRGGICAARATRI
jgi:hypothetical protein